MENGSGDLAKSSWLSEEVRKILLGSRISREWKVGQY